MQRQPGSKLTHTPLPYTRLFLSERSVETARPKARGKPERQDERKGRAERCQRHQERDPSPDQDPREDIAAELVGAQEVIEGGRREARADHDADRIIGSQPRRQDDRQNDENDGAEAEEDRKSVV